MTPCTKLFETDGMLTSIEATVTGYEQIGQDHFITLDRTIFAPEGGGQKSDEGTIVCLDGEMALGDGVKGSFPGEIRYRVSSPVAVGEKVLCKLDWDLRFMRMQQHSGEHIISGLVHQHFGYNNISFHLSDEEPVILCFDGKLSAEDAKRIETLANQAIYDDLPIEVSFPSREELSTITYRSKIEIEGQVRLVSIPGIDVCACCAPHLPSTGRIGLIKIVSMAAYKGSGTQLNVLCGNRALSFVQREHDLLTALAREYSTSAEKLTQVILTEREELRQAREKVAAFTEDALLKQIGEMAEGDVPCLFANDLSPHAMKIAYNALTKKYDRFCGVFVGSDDESYRFYAGHPAHDSRVLNSAMQEKLDAKGGGSAEMIQGKIAKKEEEIRLFFASLTE